ncbi:phycobiliprotein lyase [Roseofilum reptotaenium CS-1145]|uniref:Chromophore lyase CpcS/CpeS n=1 Tax=Roseofilum reptotaenium AO1-A TaxID=1925591 RepID=A0A1L9QS49_9CYAN|nr:MULTISPECIES: phycobiliprotein lyase [Roseofilum]MBP0030663.1 phycobiliprotein lyase [Roseofilum sp. Guam]MDB9518323.1 phycobiliprotein lyase [Roseofilum reptotaenium CS-1145]OJJ25479.1 phycobiliprotein lyase [Roseofilum reptotaenium AO1-A]
MLLQHPMTMMDFFRKSEGVWYSERTVHHFDSTINESGLSNLIVQVFGPNDPKVVELCEINKTDPATASGGASFMWQDNLDTDQEPNPNYAAVLVDIPNSDNPRQGYFLRNRGYVEGIPVIGRYHFATDGVLTIETEYERNQGQERAWFITDNFRVRVSTVKMLNGVNLMSYASERRCVLPTQLEEMDKKYQAII